MPEFKKKEPIVAALPARATHVDLRLMSYERIGDGDLYLVELQVFVPYTLVMWGRAHLSRSRNINTLDLPAGVFLEAPMMAAVLSGIQLRIDEELIVR